MGGGKLDPLALMYSGYLAELYRRGTGREFEVREIVATGGQTTTIDMVLASGERLDVITGYAGRMSKWANAAWAVPLSDYMSKAELAKWIPGALDPYWRGGKLYAVPSTAWLQGILVNTDMAKAVGMADKVPMTGQQWAMSDFMEMARRVKAQGLGFAVSLYATQPSGDYWQQLWLTGFGAELWKDGKVALDTPQGRAGVAWLVSMMEYSPPGAAGADYSVMLGGFKAGTVLAAGGGPTGWTQDIGYQFVVPPAMPGHAGKFVVGPDSALVFNTTKEIPEAVDLVRYVTGAEMQTVRVSSAGTYPTRLDAKPPVAWGSGEGKDFIGVKQLDIDRWAKAASMLADHGVWDAGIPQAAYSKVRELWLVCLQTLFLNRGTVEEAVRQFQTDANAFIAAQ